MSIWKIPDWQFFFESRRDVDTTHTYNWMSNVFKQGVSKCLKNMQIQSPSLWYAYIIHIHIWPTRVVHMSIMLLVKHKFKTFWICIDCCLSLKSKSLKCFAPWENNSLLEKESVFQSHCVWNSPKMSHLIYSFLAFLQFLAY